VTADDAPQNSSIIIKKILSAKLFDDDEGKAWKRSVKEIDGEVLCGERDLCWITQAREGRGRGSQNSC
jgi:D-Tyr-tRNAtyr deacylase